MSEPTPVFHCPMSHCDFTAASKRELWDEHICPVHYPGPRKRQTAAESWAKTTLATLAAEAGDRVSGWTLDTFPADDESGRLALDVGRRWLDDMSGPLVLHGPSGTGKTGLAYGLVMEAIHRELCEEFVWVNLARLLTDLKASYGNPEGERRSIEHLLDNRRERLVMLDDVGQERATDWSTEIVEVIVADLHLSRAPLIVTTNLAPSELVKHYGSVSGQRIVSRLLDGATRHLLVRADLRHRPAPTGASS